VDTSTTKKLQKQPSMEFVVRLWM